MSTENPNHNSPDRQQASEGQDQASTESGTGAEAGSVDSEVSTDQSESSSNDTQTNSETESLSRQMEGVRSEIERLRQRAEELDQFGQNEAEYKDVIDLIRNKEAKLEELNEQVDQSANTTGRADGRAESEQSLSPEQEQKLIETVETKKLFGWQGLKDFVATAGAGLGLGAGVGMTTRALVGAVMPYSFLTGATGGASAAYARYRWDRWSKSHYRSRQKFIKGLQEDFDSTDRRGDRFWQELGQQVKTLEAGLQAKNLRLSQLNEALVTFIDGDPKKQEKEQEKINLLIEREALNDKLRYLNSELASQKGEEAELKEKALKMISGKFSGQMISSVSIEVQEGAQEWVDQAREGVKAKVLAAARASSEELDEKERARLEILRRGRNKRILTGAAVGALFGTLGGWLASAGEEVAVAPESELPATDDSFDTGYVDHPSKPGGGIGNAAARAAETEMAETAKDIDPEVSFGPDEVDRYRAEMADPLGVEETVKTEVDESGADDVKSELKIDKDQTYYDSLEKEPLTTDPVLPTEETVEQLESLPQIVALESGDTPWGVVKGQLTEVMDREPTNVEIQTIAEQVARASDISVPEWGIEGSVDQTQLPVGYELQFNEEVRQSIAELVGNSEQVAETASDVGTGPVDFTAGEPEIGLGGVEYPTAGDPGSGVDSAGPETGESGEGEGLQGQTEAGKSGGSADNSAEAAKSGQLEGETEEQTESQDEPNDQAPETGYFENLSQFQSSFEETFGLGYINPEILADDQVRQVLVSTTYEDLSLATLNDEIRQLALSDESGTLVPLCDRVFGADSVPDQYKNDLARIVKEFTYGTNNLISSVESWPSGEPNESLWHYLEKTSVNNSTLHRQ